VRIMMMTMTKRRRRRRRSEKGEKEYKINGRVKGRLV